MHSQSSKQAALSGGLGRRTNAIGDRATRRLRPRSRRHLPANRAGPQIPDQPPTPAPRGAETRRPDTGPQPQVARLRPVRFWALSFSLSDSGRLSGSAPAARKRSERSRMKLRDQNLRPHRIRLRTRPARNTSMHPWPAAVARREQCDGFIQVAGTHGVRSFHWSSSAGQLDSLDHLVRILPCF